MRIDYLKIPSDRNLRNFEIDFDESVPMTVLLGRNGSGKSNLIENIVEIFLALEKTESPRFDYEIRYYCYQHKIDIVSLSETLTIMVDDKSVTLSAFRRKLFEYLPSYIFAYYSGWNTRLESLFAEPTKRYYRANLNTDIDSSSDATGVRRFFYCRKDYSQFALLSLFFETNEFATYIRKEILGIQSFESALFVLKTPWWSNSSRKDSDTFFWGARGNFTDFMERLRAAALAPIRNDETAELDVRGRSQRIERLYLFISDQKQLDALRAPYETPKLLFNHLESMYLSDLIEEVRITARSKTGELLTFSQLSEGEQQLITVFGLMLFTQDDEALHLLDEPDSHLNPRWVYDYLDLLKRAFKPETGTDENPFTQEREPDDIGLNQVLLATHNPLTIGGLYKNQVRVIHQIDQMTIAEPPEDDPIGIGIEGLLKSELFGLPSSLASEILLKLDRHYSLLGIPDKTQEEQLEAMQLANELNELGISRTHPNPYFEQFAHAMARRTPYVATPATKEELEAQSELADEILQEILAEENEQDKT